MKPNEFKKMLKEAVREVFQEEMKELLLEAVRSPKNTIQESYTPPMMTPTQQKTGLPSDIKHNLRSMIGGEFDATFSANSSMAQPAYNPPAVSTTGDGSSLPPGEVSLNQIMGIMNLK